MNKFREINIKDFTYNPFDLKTQWMLITASKEGKSNTMTASWGGFGIMWNKNVVYIVIRPQRYTKEFIDAGDSFSLTLFDKEYQKDLAYLGKVSGRDEDKISKTNLTLNEENGIPYFEEANLVVFADKLFAQPIREDSFLDKEIINNWYPQKDFHILYIAEIKTILKKEESYSNEVKHILP